MKVPRRSSLLDAILGAGSVLTGQALSSGEVDGGFDSGAVHVGDEAGVEVGGTYPDNLLLVAPETDGTTGDAGDANRFVTEQGPRADLPMNFHRLTKLADGLELPDGVNLFQLLSALDAAVSGMVLKRPVFAASIAALPAYTRTGNTLLANANGTLATPFGTTAAGLFTPGAYLAQFGSGGTGNGQFDLPFEVAIDGSGNLFVTDTENCRVQKFNSSGVYQSQFGSPLVQAAPKVVKAATTAALPSNTAFGINLTAGAVGAFPNQDGVAINVGDRILVKNEATNSKNGVYKLVVKGSASSAWQLQRDSDSDTDADNPVGEIIDVSAGGSTNGYTYWRKTADATLGGDYSLGAGSYFGATDSIDFDTGGNIWVVDTVLGRVVKFNSSGTYQSEFRPFDTPWAIAIDGSNGIWVTDAGDDRVVKYNTSGVQQDEFGTTGSGNGEFDWPADIAFDGSGNLFVLDWGNNRVQKFNSSGDYQSQFGSGGTGNGQFAHPRAINIDGSGNIWVTDTDNHRVQKFNSSGTYQSQFGEFGSGNGQLNTPCGADIVSTSMWVVDTANNRLQKFNLSASTQAVELLVRHEGSGSHADNGLYVLDDPGSGSTKWQMTRRDDADESGEVVFGSLVQALWEDGSSGGWFYQSTAGAISLNSTAQVWSRKQGPGIDWGLVSALPTGASVGDTCVYKADNSNGVFWDLIYDGQGSYPWKVKGGRPLVARSDTLRQQNNVTAYASLPTDPLSITAPLAGDYDMKIEVDIFTPSGVASGNGQLSYTTNASANNASDEWSALFQGVTTSQLIASVVKESRQTGIVAGNVITEKGRTGGNYIISYDDRRLSIMPVRVG